MIRAIEETCPNIYRGQLAVYETSYYGATFEFLKKNARTLDYSEFFEGFPRGALVNNIRNEDLQCLTYEDSRFDLVTSNQVFEHIPDDLAAFKEVYRVLKPGGVFLMMVPLRSGSTETKAHLVGRELKWLAPPEFHDSRHSGPNSAPVFRHYGDDILTRTAACGFSSSTIRGFKVSALEKVGEKVVICRK